MHILLLILYICIPALIMGGAIVIYFLHSTVIDLIGRKLF
jgi:hypothetical protein